MKFFSLFLPLAAFVFSSCSRSSSCKEPAQEATITINQMTEMLDEDAYKCGEDDGYFGRPYGTKASITFMEKNSSYEKHYKKGYEQGKYEKWEDEQNGEYHVQDSLKKEETK